MVDIHKNNPKYKLWKIKNEQKNFRNKLKRKKRKKKNKKVKNDVITNRMIIPMEFIVPVKFSIINNSEETISFLNKIISEVEKIRKMVKHNRNKAVNLRLFSINMDNTKEITSDALMYLLTIIKNTRGKRVLPINWKGNFPKDENMKIFLQNSGYLEYMVTAKENLGRTNDNIQIKVGQGYEYKYGNEIVDIRKEIIDFTCEKLNVNKTKINFLMTMLTEMITNITDHAYDEKNLFEHSWYIFVENNADKISYTFMDNGLGIPTTIKKSKIEQILGYIFEKEYKYIEAGVSGLERRSKTGRLERGNGLPSIYEQYTSHKISKLVIISNKAYYTDDEPKDLDNSLNGTIFYWEIKKDGVI